MQSRWIVMAAAALIGAHAGADEASGFKDRREQESYAIGAQTGRTLKADKGDVDIDLLIRGLKDGYGGGKLRISEDDLRLVMSRVQQELHKNLVLKRRAAAAHAAREPVVRPSAVQDAAGRQSAAREPAGKEAAER